MQIIEFLRDIKKAFREFLFPSYAPKFKGWYGMTLYTDPPWTNSFLNPESIEHKFNELNDHLFFLVRDGSFKLLQFKDQKKIQNTLSQLSWRHYIVYWSCIYAINQTDCEEKNLVEVGVADGLTVFFALNAAKQSKKTFNAFLYDTWSEVELDNPSTKGKTREYSQLSINSTKNNLKSFEKNVCFIQGLIPETLNDKKEPEKIIWLHIDLNSSKPTLETIQHFWKKIDHGGLILLDDYAQPAYLDTKKVVDKWVSDQNKAQILQLPTSQAIIFKV